MKVLVTGANGYLGQGVVKTLLDLGNEVVATDFSLQNIDIRATRIKADLFDVDNPYQFFQEPDVLLHMAWKDGFVHYSDTHIMELPLHYEFIKKMSLEKIKKIAVMGSMHEVGFYEGSIDENTPCNPESFYGISKNALREITKILCAQKQIVYQWFRGFYIVGNAEYGCSIFSKIAKAEKERKESFPFTMGLNQFDFIDYDVFCRQIADAIMQDKVTGVINICSGRPETLSSRVERFIKENGYDIKLEYGAFPDRPYDSKAVWGNNKKIEEIEKRIV